MQGLSMIITFEEGNLMLDFLSHGKYPDDEAHRTVNSAINNARPLWSLTLHSGRAFCIKLWYAYCSEICQFSRTLILALSKSCSSKAFMIRPWAS